MKFTILCLATVLSVSFSPAADDTAANLVPQAQQFVTLLAHEDYQKAEDQFDATMQAALPAEKLKEAWTGVIQEGGAFQSLGSTRTETAANYRIVYVTCRLEKKAVSAKVVFDPDNKVGGLFFQPGESGDYKLPSYAKPALFTEKEVTVGAGDWKLPGTLSLPAGKGPFPALVLVQGSGPEDRDETVGANKPFRDLASGLASKGIAVLRYEKRTKEYAAKIAAGIEGFTVKEETIADALEAVALLRKTEGVDPNRVFVLGHSLGGTLIPRIGAGRTDIAGFIILAGAARPLEDLALEQARYQASLAGEPSAEDKKALEQLQAKVQEIKNLSKANAPKGLILGAPASYWLDLRGYNPPAAAASLTQPMLILQGDKDCQVSPTNDFTAWQKALAGHADASLWHYPDLNHLFIVVEGKSTGAEYQVPGHVAERVVNVIAAFIKSH